MWFCAHCGSNTVVPGIFQPCGRCGTASPYAQQIQMIRDSKQEEADQLTTQLLTQASEQHHAQQLLHEAELEAAKTQVESAKRQTMLPEEEFALATQEVLRVELLPTRCFRGLTPREVHFRTVESQFLRMLGSQKNKVSKVEYVINPQLLAAFESKQEELAGVTGEEQHPVLAFHGTTSQNMESIVQHNFDIGLLSKGSGDKGWYGAGIYFSELPTTAMSYGKGEKKLLLSKVLLGREFQCPGRMDGKQLQLGYDSHRSPDGSELVVFDQAQILPCYIVHYS